MHKILSLPPEANYFPSNDHLSPHTSYVCEVNFYITELDDLKS